MNVNRLSKQCKISFFLYISKKNVRWMGTPNTEGIKQLVDQEIDVTIGMLPDFSAIFNSPVIGLDSLGVQRETDFYLGMAWASITDGFNSAIVDTYKRPMTIDESKILVERILARLPELKKAISDLGM